VIVALGFVDDPGLSGVVVHRLPWQAVAAATKPVVVVAEPEEAAG
jgi:hypothetical protein